MLTCQRLQSTRRNYWAWASSFVVACYPMTSLLLSAVCFCKYNIIISPTLVCGFSNEIEISIVIQVRTEITLW